MTVSDEWSPDEPMGTETFRQGDVAEDESERLSPEFREVLEQDPSLDPALVADEVELEEIGAQLDDPQLQATLQGGMDDPDGIGTTMARPRAEDEGWNLDAALTEGDDGDRGENVPAP
jgi:hypothetical protein